MNTLIVGGGHVVYYLTKTFIAKGYHVTIVNHKKDQCSRLARQLKATIVFGNATDPQVLADANANAMNAVLAVTPNDEDNLVICQLAKLNFGVLKTLALVNDPDNEEVFQQLGVTTAFSTTHIISSLIEQRSKLEDIVAMSSVAEGRVNVTEVLLQDDSPVLNQSLKVLEIPEDSLIACILRDDKPIIPRGTTTLHAHDRLLLITMPETHGQVLRFLTGSNI